MYTLQIMSGWVHSETAQFTPPDAAHREGGGGIKKIKYGCRYAKICHKMIRKLGCALTQTCDMPRLMINLTLTTLYISYCYWMKSNTIH